jgi:hypothetical protein
MTESLPYHIQLVFTLTTALTLWLFYKGTGSKNMTVIAIVWLMVQSIIARTGFYTVTDSLPPRFLFLVGPPLLIILFLFLTKDGRRLIDSFDPKWLTYLHTVRIPVEMVLLWLFIYKMVPQLMTFEGRNFDILSGLSAPFVAYLGYRKKTLSRNTLLAWNFICLALLFNIVINAVLSVPTPFQKFGFEQPNIGVLYFPFIWLPCFIVPAVLLSHLVCIRKLLKLNAPMGKTED